MIISRCLVWATVLGVVASAAAVDSSPKSAGDDRAARSAAMPDLHFQPYREQEPYRSSEFLNSSIEDKVMEAVYMGVNWFIGRIGKPFPHEDVLKRDALVGDPTALVESLKERYPQWISYDQWFLVVAGVCLVLAAVFTIVYLFYLCCRCCCCRKKYKSKNKADLKYDSCRRRSCNAFLAVLVVINIFAVAALFISCQYAHEGAQELPRRLTRSVDDLAVYKRDSGNRIRKLLVNDYEQMNATILEAIQDAASVLVDRIKKVTGAQALDELVGISEEAMDMQDSLVQFEQSLQSLDDDIKKL
uniref:Uncharacterized protein n=1 Tax=Plectus sambesii TaxID=2011161 RepID=A0A914XDM4_9BILA